MDAHDDAFDEPGSNTQRISPSNSAPKEAGETAAPQRIEIPERRFAPIKGENLDVSSDEEVGPDAQFPEADVQSIISVSIGKAQTRLTSPQTPAAEKNAVLEQAEGDQGLDRRFGFAEESREALDIPTPWRATPKTFKREESIASVLHGDTDSTHQGDASNAAANRRLLPFGLPSMPKTGVFSNLGFPSLPSISFLGGKPDQSDSEQSATRSKRSGTLHPKPSAYWNVPSSKELSRLRAKSTSQTTSTTPDIAGHRPIPRRPASQDAKLDNGSSLQYFKPKPPGPLQDSRASDLKEERLGEHSAERRPVEGRPSPLRRSTSDNSLVLTRSLSRVSSLGDDTRFEHVQDQINSRFKAIRDSFADSSFKLPSISNFSISTPRFLDGSTTPEYQRRDSLRQRANTFGGKKYNTSILGTAPSTKSQASPLMPPKGTLGAPFHASDPSSHLANALSSLTGDVVIMGGYRGSILRSAKPPNRQMWIPVKVGLNLRKVNLEVGLTAEDEESMQDRIIPSGMLTHIGPVDISRRLLKRLQSCENALSGKLRIWNYGYDWRLSPGLLSRKLLKFIEGLPCNSSGTHPKDKGATVIAHSLGGLLTRHAVNERPELFSGVVYAGVPQTCVNILGPLRNGDEVLLSSRVLTAQVNFTLRTSFVLLPEDGYCFIDAETKEEYPVDFFDVDTWIDHCLSPCVAPPVLPLGARNGLVSSLSGSLASLPISAKRSSFTLEASKANLPEKSGESLSTKAANITKEAVGGKDHTIAPQLNGQSTGSTNGQGSNGSTSLAVTIPREEAISYLRRTLSETLEFKRGLRFQPKHANNNAYPPVAVLYGKTLPTVYGAKVNGREGIKRADAYDNLAFASGDGVCLARAAMVPEGYEVARGGRVSSDRGHVTLLGDLEGVGQCLEAINTARRRGVGQGKSDISDDAA
ncbi:MAG: hypothetical protein M4579_005508 [Chaenotheca gracillima]|nr:MAG: hypothetical protein M4579_005508 [Chaenotheca gracillima]